MGQRIGVLLGEYDGSQSFTQQGSWQLTMTQASMYLQTTTVHSSSKALRLDVFSGASGVLKYDYAHIPDLYDRWSLDVTTHKAAVSFWAYTSAAAYSGWMVASLITQQTPIPHGASLQKYELATSVTSATGMAFIITINGTLTGSLSLYVDDVLPIVDYIDLTPELDAEDREELERAEHTTISGRQQYYTWCSHKNWEVPVRLVTDSESNLLNEWWAGGKNLVYSDQTSDSSRAFITRLGGDSRPLQQLERPYHHLWRGSLPIAAISDGLEY